MELLVPAEQVVDKQELAERAGFVLEPEAEPELAGEPADSLAELLAAGTVEPVVVHCQKNRRHRAEVRPETELCQRILSVCCGFGQNSYLSRFLDVKCLPQIQGRL